MKRNYFCNLSPLPEAPGSPQDLLGQELHLCGWVKKIRRHGALSFINLRDRYGELQLTMDGAEPGLEPAVVEAAQQLHQEFCIAVSGPLQLRPESMRNADMPTGQFELRVQQLKILSPCATLPFALQKGGQKSGESEGSEALRLQYRYLDLRSEGMKNRLLLRHQLQHEIHNFLHKLHFIEVDTPTLIRSMPEGARDYLVPSRQHPGNFYALPQSPQIYKQLLMVGGLDRYYQLARCYRDEDARGDRQPEFVQLDLELSFVSGGDVQRVLEGLLASVWQRLWQRKLPQPVRLSYDEAMNRYGSDKPDLRNPLLIHDFTGFGCQSGFGVFAQSLEQGGCVKVLVAPQATCSRKTISLLEQEAKKHGAKGLAWTRVGASGFEGGIARFLADQFAGIAQHYSLRSGDLLFFGADAWQPCCQALGAVRKKLGEDLGLIDKEAFAFAWVVDFPLFLPTETKELGEATGVTDTGWTAAHHIFCQPYPQYLDSMEKNPGAVRGDIYDLVLNGYELGSGSVRIHRADVQQRAFEIVGYPSELVQQRFGFLLEALRYGAPPHGGFALGLDRLAMIMAGEQSIKEVIAFPKNNQGQSLLDLSPGAVTTQQLRELQIASLPNKPE